MHGATPVRRHTWWHAASSAVLLHLSIPSGVKVKPSGYNHASANGTSSYSPYSLLISALDGGEWSASRPGRSLPPGELVWTQRLKEKFFASLKDRTPVVQSVVRHYTDVKMTINWSVVVVVVANGTICRVRFGARGVCGQSGSRFIRVLGLSPVNIVPPLLHMDRYGPSYTETQCRPMTTTVLSVQGNRPSGIS
jgi:hypothetical protein